MVKMDTTGEGGGEGNDSPRGAYFHSKALGVGKRLAEEGQGIGVRGCTWPAKHAQHLFVAAVDELGQQVPPAQESGMVLEREPLRGAEVEQGGAVEDTVRGARQAA